MVVLECIVVPSMMWAREHYEHYNATIQVSLYFVTKLSSVVLVFLENIMVDFIALWFQNLLAI